MKVEGYFGELNPALCKHEIIPAMIGRAPLEDDELPVALQLNFDESMPVVISFYQYYRFLDNLLTVIFEENIFDLVLVRIKMPSTIGLPSILLDERVVIFHDVDTESAYLTEKGVNHVVVDADFKLYSWSAGNNKYTIRYVSDEKKLLKPYELKKLKEVISTLPATINVI